MAPVRMKVRISDLLAAVEKKKAEAITDFAKRRADYERALPAAVRERNRLVVATLREAIKNPEVVKASQRYDGRTQLSTWMDGHLPDLPVEPPQPDLTRFDRDIALLKMAADETITIGQNNDWASYL